MGVGLRFRSIPEGRGLRTYTGWTTLPDNQTQYMPNMGRFQIQKTKNYLKNPPTSDFLFRYSLTKPKV
jgi:hypothetical protein